MPTVVLGSQIYEIVPTVQATGGSGGDPVTISQAGNIPSVLGGSGPPSGAPTYGAGSVYVDTTNFVLYAYFGSQWNVLSGSGVANTINTPTVVPTDYSYVVVGYLTINSTFTLNGNARIL